MRDQDFEDILASSNDEKHKKEKISGSRESLGSVFVGLGNTIKVKVLIFIFITYIILNSEYFVHNVLCKMSPNAVDGQVINGTGVVIQAILFVLFCAVFISLDSKDLI